MFDSSIAEDYRVRQFFIDMCALSDRHGVVDMTPEAIAARTRIPLKLVKQHIRTLSQPDKRSRSPKEDGKRIVPLDNHRDWGWTIVNYTEYHSLGSEDDRRERQRLIMQQRRGPNDVNKLATMKEEVLSLPVGWPTGHNFVVEGMMERLSLSRAGAKKKLKTWLAFGAISKGQDGLYNPES